MPRVLGVTCSGGDAYLTVIDVDATTGVDVVLPIGPERVRPVSAGDHGDGLVRSLAGWRRVLAGIAPDAVALLLPESGARTQKVHASWAPRCEAETLVGIAAGLAGMPYDHIARATVRSRLSGGKLDTAAKSEPAQGRSGRHTRHAVTTEVLPVPWMRR